MNPNIEKLCDRFKNEKNNIESYIELMKEVLVLPTYSDIHSYIKNLKEYVSFNNDISHYWSDIINLEDAATIYNCFNEILDDLNESISFFKNELSKVVDNWYFNRSELTDLEDSIITFIFEHGYYDFFHSNNNKLDTYEDLKQFFRLQLDEYEKALSIGDPKYLDEHNIEIKGRNEQSLIDYCISLAYEENISNIDNIKTFFYQLSIRIQANNQSNTLNVFRQGFILLVAAVDATVFDAVRLLLDNCFFKYIGSFSQRDDKIKISELKDYNDFNEFKESEIRKRLKGKYIKDLFRIFEELGLQYVKGNLTELVECVNRRNIHIHNQGVVDKQYEEDINPYNLREGDIATITEQYFQNTCILLEALINAMCNWIDEKL